MFCWARSVRGVRCIGGRWNCLLMLWMKGTFSSFDSPQKPQTPWREPATPSSSLFSPSGPTSSSIFTPTSPSKPMADYFRKPSFTTPRQIMVDFSSGPENQSSPENADNDDTPERHGQDGITLTKTDGTMQFFTGNKMTDKKQPALALFSKYISPGRGEVSRGKHSDAVAGRVHKRRRRDISRDNRLAHRRSSYESDSDSRSRRSSSENATQKKKQQPPAEAGFIPSLFTFIETHPNLPHILSYYAQFVLNLFIVFFCIYITYSFWSTIRSDVDAKSEAVVAETLAEMAVCTQKYVENRCDRASRVPAMETVCENWERCMNKDAYSVGRARVSAHTFAEIFNSFLEPISYKAMVNDIPVHRMCFPTSLDIDVSIRSQIFSLTLLFGCVAISNLAFGFFRNKTHPLPHGAYSYPLPPAHQPQMSYPAGARHPYENPSMDVPWQGSESDRWMQTPMKRVGYR